MELILVILTAILCTILFIKSFLKLRSILPWRVNCWFCNHNFWMKYKDRNSWTCLKCDQYNGFTKDGDYNKPLVFNTDEPVMTPKVFHRSSPSNGLCKMCNINQQLKVFQLANFVPMNEKNYNEEVETYNVHLEKAYRLCSPCKKVLTMKLNKEKETLLGTKLLEKRTPDKIKQKIERENQRLKTIINSTSKIIAWLLVFLVSIEFYKNMTRYKHLSVTLNNLNDILFEIAGRIVSIIKMKILLTFPTLEEYILYDWNKLIVMEKMWTVINIHEFDKHLSTTQKTLGGFVCLIQIIGHIWNVNKLKHTIIIDILWSVFVTTFIVKYPVDLPIISLIKLASTLAILLVYRKMYNIKARESTKLKVTPKKMKNVVNGSLNSLLDDEDNLSLDTDDDVSLSKFGLNNFSESSNETVNVHTNSIFNGRSFTPRCENVWSKPKHNSTFCINTVPCKSPSSVSDNVFIKPSFNKYQKLIKEDSDSDLDESISSLCISSPKKTNKTNSIFSLRKFNATPCFVVPTPVNRSRPLISPSKLGHSTSWVAGGYWGSEGDRQMLNIDGSRSSSQSSGFESQASSVTQRNIFSQPPSREESVCGEPMVVDSNNFRPCNMSNFSTYQAPKNVARINSPVFLQMQHNSHVHIPQPRFVNKT
ncbi:hypothetical protein ACJJTC_007608 [Scirpophaga incertulas]